jgi:superfamily II DNA or RNA helicase
MISITDFLPKYPSIDKEENDIFNVSDYDFYQAIYNKREFYELKLDKTEDRPKNKGDLYKHQRIIARYMSSYTPYNKILLIHSMGTGKTCATIGAIEQIKREGRDIYKKALIVASKGLLNNFQYDLLNVCTPGEYIPDLSDLSEYTDQETLDRINIRRINKNVKTFYDLSTYWTLASQIEKNYDSMIKKYSNSIIVIDEIQYLQLQKKNKKRKSNLNVYNQFYRFLHGVKNSKIILLSGTPMKLYFILIKYNLLLI